MSVKTPAYWTFLAYMCSNLQGEVFGLLGPNGAGKTTTIKMLITLLPLTSGSARVAGFDIVHQKADVRRTIGYVPQALSADGTLTGYENLLLFAKLWATFSKRCLPLPSGRCASCATTQPICSRAPCSQPYGC